MRSKYLLSLVNANMFCRDDSRNVQTTDTPKLFWKSGGMDGRLSGRNDSTPARGDLSSRGPRTRSEDVSERPMSAGLRQGGVGSNRLMSPSRGYSPATGSSRPTTPYMSSGHSGMAGGDVDRNDRRAIHMDGGKRKITSSDFDSSTSSSAVSGYDGSGMNRQHTESVSRTHMRTPKSGSVSATSYFCITCTLYLEVSRIPNGLYHCNCQLELCYHDSKWSHIAIGKITESIFALYSHTRKSCAFVATRYLAN